MQEKSENSLENLESLKQTITLDFQNLKELVNGMAKSIVAFTQAKIDISHPISVYIFLYIMSSYKDFGQMVRLLSQ